MSYQTIPGVTGKGERDCRQRWELIRPELPAAGVVLDIGAAEGYFLKAVADETDLLAVGVEKHAGRVRCQHRWLAGGYAGRVVACHGALSTDLVTRIARTPEWFDAVLLLSTLHWINNDQFLAALSQMAGMIIVEIPDVDDRAATGQRFMDRVRAIGGELKYFKSVTGRKVRLLGQVKAHTHATRNVWIIKGDLERSTRIPHINFAGKKGAYIQAFRDGRLTFDNTKRPESRQWIPGVNLATLAAMGVTYPSQKWWDRQVDESIRQLDPAEPKGDLRSHNCIVTRGGLQWIDQSGRGHKPTIHADIEGLVRDV